MTFTEDQSKLDLEIIRGPLAAGDAQTVLAAYNRLALNDIQQDNFKRWLCDSPSGPAIHVLLRNSNGEIVGHDSIFPFPLSLFGQTVIGGKSEYLFVDPNYRKSVVRGHEPSGPFPTIVLLKALYQEAREQLQWDPVLTSSPPDVEAIHRRCGAKPVDFPLVECLFIRRPVQAARCTPNLTTKYRLALFAIGLAHSVLWAIYRAFTFGRTTCLQEEPIETVEPMGDSAVDKIAFSRTAAYLQWRYPADQFTFYRVGQSKDDFVIARKGSPTGYLRVCAASISSSKSLGVRLVADLMKEASKQRAIGVRWSVYQNASASSELLSAFRRLGMLCVKRTRKFSIMTRNERCLDSNSWIMEDSATAFEH